MKSRVPIVLALPAIAVLALALAPARADDEPWIIEATPEAAGAEKAGAAAVAKAQKLAKKKKYVDAVKLLETTAREHPAAVHDCNLSLAYLRAGALTRAQLFHDVAQLRNAAARPSWCTGDLAKQLSTALTAAGYVPLTITVTPADAVVEVGGVAIRGVHLLWLAPGPQTVRASAPGMLEQRVEIELEAPNGSVSIQLAPPAPEVDAAVEIAVPVDAAVPEAIVPDAAPPEPDPGPPPPAKPVRWPAYVGFGVGGLALVVGILEHARALDATEEGNALYPSQPEFADAVDRFESARTWAIASYVVSAAATGFGVYWLATHRVTVSVGREEALVLIGGDL